jgi:hypothetical protein
MVFLKRVRTVQLKGEAKNNQDIDLPERYFCGVAVTPVFPIVLAAQFSKLVLEPMFKLYERSSEFVGF